MVNEFLSAIGVEKVQGLLGERLDNPARTSEEQYLSHFHKKAFTGEGFRVSNVCFGNLWGSWWPSGNQGILGRVRDGGFAGTLMEVFGEVFTSTQPYQGDWPFYQSQACFDRLEGSLWEVCSCCGNRYEKEEAGYSEKDTCRTCELWIWAQASAAAIVKAGKEVHLELTAGQDTFAIRGLAAKLQRLANRLVEEVENL